MSNSIKKNILIQTNYLTPIEDTYNANKFDQIDIEIIEQLLIKPNIKSAEISYKLNIPLSTIQRRLRRIEGYWLQIINHIKDK